MTTTSPTVYAKLLNAQKAMRQPKLDKENPHFKSKYSTLSECLQCIQKPLQDAGLILTQDIICNYLEGGSVYHMELLTKVIDEDGHTLVLATHPIQNGTMQAIGSAITYARRYSLCAAFGLVGDEDDDGAAASTKPPAPVKKPASKKNPYLEQFGVEAKQLAADAGLSMQAIMGLVEAQCDFKLASVNNDSEAAEAVSILRDLAAQYSNQDEGYQLTIDEGEAF